MSSKQPKGAGSAGGGAARAARRGAGDSPPSSGAASSGEDSHLAWGRRNYLILGGGLGVIVVGFLLLALGDTTIAPILLVGGYLGLIPWGIVAAARRTPSG